MHAPIADVQSNPDWRNLAVDRVGIRRLKFPIVFEDITEAKEPFRQSVVGYFDMLVDLPKTVKGTHMSRFIEILNEEEIVLSVATLPILLEKMIARLGAQYGFLQVNFPYFIKKAAPISQAMSLMDYDISLTGIYQNNQSHIYVSMTVPVTSLCPCSKEIADYGAHNQRSHVTVTVETKPSLSIIEIIRIVESKASCELYGILKRSDEKAVTERAYDNPKFVEDMVRDISSTLSQHPAILSHKVASENFESIHNHSAYAEIDKLSLPFPSSVLNVVENRKTLECA